MFCPKCGSILTPKKDGEKSVLACECGYTSGKAESLKEEAKKSKPLEVVEEEFEANPTTEAECGKCGNKTAFYWLKQTRAGDEPETKFMKCTKCKHTWRDAS